MSDILPVDRNNRCMTSGNPETPDHRETDPVTGLQKDYVILCEDERAKGFVRPVRRTYRHVGIRPQYPLRDLTDEEQERYAQWKYVKYEEYPEDPNSSAVGRFWTEAQLNSGCGGETTMSLPIAETYARDPGFYGGTYCATCRAHFPVGEQGEFIWLDGSRVGT